MGCQAVSSTVFCRPRSEHPARFRRDIRYESPSDLASLPSPRYCPRAVGLLRWVEATGHSLLSEPLALLFTETALFFRGICRDPICVFESCRALLHGQSFSQPANHVLVCGRIVWPGQRVESSCPLAYVTRHVLVQGHGWSHFMKATPPSREPPQQRPPASA